MPSPVKKDQPLFDLLFLTVGQLVPSSCEKKKQFGRCLNRVSQEPWIRIRSGSGLVFSLKCWIRIRTQ
jgi:hypothetical protein